MSTTSYISGSLLKHILDVAEEHGASRQAMFAGITAQDPSSDSATQIPVLKIVELFENIQTLTKRPEFGLDVGSSIRPGSLNALGYALMSSKNLYEALKLQKSFGAAISNCAALQIDLDHPSLASVSFTIPDLDPEISRPLHEMFLSMFWNYAKWITQTQGQLAEVRFTHSAPDYIDAYTEAFEIRPLFNQSKCQLRFEKRYLDAPLYQADKNLNNLMREQTATLLQEAKAILSYYTAVAKELQQLMPQQKATLTIVASKLNMSERTLSRKLKDEGFTFKEVLLSVRESLAIKYLKEYDLNVNEIANKLGYLDYSSFSHAFRCWTGLSPSEYRETNKSIAPVQSPLPARAAP